MSRQIFFLMSAAALAVLNPSLCRGQRAPEIRITQAPPRGAGGPDQTARISGTVAGVDFSQYKVLLYVRTNQWYVQPYADSPYTRIDSKGKWAADTHLGTQYAALLVKESHTGAAATLSELPPVGGDVVAIEIKPGRTP